MTRPLRPASQVDPRRRMVRYAADWTARAATWAVAGASIAVLLVIIGQIVIRGLPGFRLSFLVTAPHGIKMEGGVFPMIVASSFLTVLTLLIVGPVGIGAAVYLSLIHI